MIVKDNYGFRGSVEAAIQQMLLPMADGQVERLAERISLLENIVARHIASKITTVEELNHLAGFAQFEEVKNG